MSIHVLDSATIDKIAAGEVVERPSSVVKELVENSIDAGATAITVEIKDGGTSFIRVTDNGSGIRTEELRTAFLRHATSKISSAEDLDSIVSLGFRGEALSSICAVAQVELITKTKEALVGVRMTLEGAQETGFDEIGAPQGTTMIVRNLFFNTPVRKKFLKSASTEGSYVADLMEHLALSRPDISFQLTMNHSTRFHTSGNGDLREVIYRIYGREIAGNLIPINVSQEGITIQGYLGKPVLTRSNRNYEIYFVNGRFIRSSVIANSIEEGFREYLMQHKFPLCVLQIETDPSLVDVNVHPTKMDVRISNPQNFYGIVSGAIYRTLKKSEMIPGDVLTTKQELKERQKEAIEEVRQGKNPEPFMVPSGSNSNTAKNIDNIHSASYIAESVSAGNLNTTIDTLAITVDKTTIKDNIDLQANSVAVETHKVAEEADVFFEETDSYKSSESSLDKNETVKSTASLSGVSGSNLSSAISIPEIKDLQQMNLFEDKILSQDNRAKFRIIGQVFSTYFLVQYENKLLIVDQHAAHEKVNYERMMKRFANREVLTQNLLPPLIISLSSKEEMVLKEHMDAFHNLGFDVEHFGGNEYALRGVPVELYRNGERELFLSVLDELSEGNSRGSFKVIEEKIASMACKASVKGGDHVTVQEMEALLSEMLLLENPYNCPHGRPTTIAMTEEELEKKFKRIVEN